MTSDSAQQTEKWSRAFLLLHSLWNENALPEDTRWGVLLGDLTEVLRVDPKIQISSSNKEILEHPAFILLLQIGPPLIPWVFKQYSSENHGWWCPMFLYRTLTLNQKEAVVLGEHAGQYDLIREDWLKWGKEQGYIK